MTKHSTPTTPSQKQLRNTLPARKNPSEATLKFLQQFARIYTYRQSSHPVISTIIPN